MGNCCRSSSRNEGINLEENLAPLPNLSGKKILTESEVLTILKRAYTVEYNTKLYEKRNLQSRRAKILSGNKKKPNDQYLGLIQQTKELEAGVFKEAIVKVLKDCKVDPKVFEASKEKLKKNKLDEAVAKSLMEEIKELRDKLGLNEDKVIELKEKYRAAYDEADFMLSSYPDIAQKLAALFENELYLEYTDFVATDTLYNDYKLLPIEMVSFTED